MIRDVADLRELTQRTIGDVLAGKFKSADQAEEALKRGALIERALAPRPRPQTRPIGPSDSAT